MLRYETIWKGTDIYNYRNIVTYFFFHHIYSQGYNGTFVFSLLDEGRQFAIDPLTGVITVADLLDHEKQEHYGLVVSFSSSREVPGNNIGKYLFEKSFKCLRF